MKFLLSHDRSWAYRSLLLLTLLTLAVGLWGRVYDLGFPARQVWDEIYFPVMADKYLKGIYFFDLHPPLGKFIIAVSIALFGDTPVAWRLMPAVFGIALLPLGFFLGWSLFKQRVGALLLAAFLAGETILIVHSRIGVMEILLVFFTLATFLAALVVERRGQAIWPAVLLGVTISIKWADLPVVIPAGYVLWRKGLLRPFLAGLWVAAIIYIAIIYVERLIIVTANPVQAWVEVWEWHIQAAHKIGAAVPHLWGSPWWSWPIMLRPIRYYYGANPEGLLQVISAIGNPLIWWSGTLAVVVSIFDIVRKAVARKLSADDPIIPIVLGYVFLLAPWVAGTRIPYIYNYLPIYPFAILALVYWLCKIWNRLRWGPWVVVSFTACAVALTVFFLPLVLAIPITEDDLMRRVWIDYWFDYERPVPGSGCLVPNPTKLCPQ